MVRALLSAGAKVDLLATKAASPLHVACFKGYMEVVRALLSAGAKVNLQSVDGMSPLNMACHKGHTEVVRALLSVGAKVNLQASDGSTPLHPACENCSSGGFEWTPLGQPAAPHHYTKEQRADPHMSDPMPGIILA